jgi:hypothetical protein
MTEEDNMNAPEIMTVITVFDRILAAVGLLRAKKKERSERTDQALYALYTALNETEAYMSYLESGNEPDRKRELFIAKLWIDASVPLRQVDRDLAERCFIKSRYWSKRGTWTALMINRKRIDLNQVIESIRDLLMESS